MYLKADYGLPDYELEIAQYLPSNSHKHYKLL